MTFAKQRLSREERLKGAKEPLNGAVELSQEERARESERKPVTREEEEEEEQRGERGGEREKSLGPL